MEPWRKVWREGFVPFLSIPGLQALKRALEENDERLIQGSTTQPPPLECILDWPVEAACGISFCAWQGDGLEFIGQVEEAFARSCMECDQALDDPAGCRHFLNYFDETPREEMISKLLPEVILALEQKEAGRCK